MSLKLSEDTPASAAVAGQSFYVVDPACGDMARATAYIEAALRVEAQSEYGAFQLCADAPLPNGAQGETVGDVVGTARLSAFPENQKLDAFTACFKRYLRGEMDLSECAAELNRIEYGEG